MIAASFCFTSAGTFFLVGLLTGAWKYAGIAGSPEARAPVYVDVAHRTSLLYAFACGLLAALCERSAWSNRVNLTASIVLVVFFAASVTAYVVHGALRDTDNQLQRPHRLGRRTVPPAAMRTFMILLMISEIGGFVVLFTGYLSSRTS
jgi:hypothetical protein